ncbi:MAG: protein kinase [Elusimicrobiota bacterium]
MTTQREVFFCTLFASLSVLASSDVGAGGGQTPPAQTPQTTTEQISQYQRDVQEKMLQAGGHLRKDLSTAMDYLDWLAKQDPTAQATGLEKMTELMEDLNRFNEMPHGPGHGQRELLHEIRQDLDGMRSAMGGSSGPQGPGGQTNPQQGGPSGQNPGGQSPDSQAHGTPQTWKEIQGLVGDNAPVNTELAKAYLLAGQPQNALDAARKAALMDPNYAPAYSVMSKAYHDLGDPKNANQAAVKCLSLDPKDGMANAVARLTAGRGDPSSMTNPAADKPQMREGSRFFGVPGNPPAVKTVSGADLARLLQLKDYNGAAAALSRAIRAEPNNLDLRLTHISALSMAKRYEEALAAANEALKAFPNNSKLLSSRAGINNYLGKADLALLDAEKAILADPRNAQAWLQKGLALDRLGIQRQDKLESFRKAAELNPAYRSYYEQAMALADGELARRLMGGETRAKPPAEKEGGWAGLSPGIKRGLIIGVSSLLGGLMLALGLMGFGGREFKTKIMRLFAGLREASPNVGDMADAVAAGASDGPGRTIAGSYKVVRKIGIGGMGIVYEGLDTALGRRVAVKKMREEIRMDNRERERFLQEARTVATLHHPNIVDIYAIVDDGQDAYLVFEFVDGKTLSELLQTRKRLPYAEALALTKGVAAALEYAHGKNVVHRDLKPSNIMMNAERQIKVMDFGVARQAKDCLGRLSMTNTVVGTPPYMAPEQEQGMVGRGSDIYALAICFYELLSGELPFGGVGAGMLLAKMNKTYIPLSRKLDGLPQGLDRVLDKALDPDPARRHPSAADLYRELAALVSKNGH